MAEINSPHIPVLLAETIEALSLCEGQTIIDCTAGFGGHSSQILKKIGPTGTLICIDKDPVALAFLKNRFKEYKNVEYFHDTFDHIDEALNGRKADAILADIGISSLQYDEADRGFSYRYDAPLDMRFDQTADQITAKHIVNTFSAEQLADIFRRYSDEKYAMPIAKNIVRYRQKKQIETTFELVDIIKSSMPAAAMRKGHPAKGVFQALRVCVNSEMEILEAAIPVMFDCLKVGGTLSIISFNSCDTRCVKLAYRELCKGCQCPTASPVCTCGITPRAKLKHKPISASDVEIAQNNRSRTAQLRSIVKIKD